MGICEYTYIPTAIPTTTLTATPTAIPTTTPTAIPTTIPTAIPTTTPTIVPTYIGSNIIADKPSMNKQSIIGIVIGIIIVTIIIIFIIIIIIFKKRHKNKILVQSGNNEKIIDKIPSMTEDDNISNFESTQIIKKNKDRYLISDKEIHAGEELGEGAYAIVKKGAYEGNTVAIKYFKDINDIQDFINEITALIEIEPHPNIINIFGICLNPISIVMEYANIGSLNYILFNKKQTTVKYSREFIVNVLHGVIFGLKCLHDNNIIHRDIASRNILLIKNDSNKIIAKLSDFGFSRIIKSKKNIKRTNTDVGPLKWLAPESLKNREYSEKSDIWSFGILVFECIARKEPYRSINKLDIQDQVANGLLKPEIPDKTETVFKDLMTACWNFSPTERPPANELLEYIANI